MRKTVSLSLSTGSTFVVKKLLEYLQVNHMSCAVLFAEVTLTYLFIILCSRVLHAIPSHEAIDTVEGFAIKNKSCLCHGKILGVLDFKRDAWTHRDDLIKNGKRLQGFLFSSNPRVT
ncbi:uncharacterized protein [Primulina huaijiensis]|uniref:uncharacterized protein isoform X2 n=1 Tax=Primulina huaijiensis TaxID=1492673 RepID=UPI003CC718F2